MRKGLSKTKIRKIDAPSDMLIPKKSVIEKAFGSAKRARHFIREKTERF